jgi:hypothetical protein
MSRDAMKATAEKLVAHCRARTERQALKELYDPDAVSVEAVAMPGAGSAETHGVKGIEGKHEWWDSAMEVHSASADGPYPHGDDRFAVIFEFDSTDRASGKRSQMKEVAVYTVNPAGKIIREEFFYGG